MLEIAPALKPLDPPPPTHPAHVDVPAAATEPPEGAELPSFETLDRVARAMTARVTQGVSPNAQLAAWTDWISHLSRAPGRQLELAQQAMIMAARFTQFAVRAGVGKAPAPPFPPHTGDRRF